MNVDGYSFMTDSIAKFFNTIRISGWFHHDDDALASIRLLDPHVISATSTVRQPSPGVPSLGLDKGFTLQVLRDIDSYDAATELEFVTEAGWVFRVSLGALGTERRQLYPTPALFWEFRDRMQALPGGARVLDVGGRARSGTLRKEQIAAREFVVFDVLPDTTVDVVGDAHDLARHFPPEHFDGVLSVSVFEHLIMPWTVVTQINRVLKPGGIAMIFTHQALGMHDVPWDFWRFSDTAWDGLFNAQTGFEIVTRALDSEQFIVPCVITAEKERAEQAVGFEGSAVLVRKTGPCRMEWPLTAADVTGTLYPTG